MNSLDKILRPIKRRALIIYCTDTPSGKLDGTKEDNSNLCGYLKSCTGGCWMDDEIISLINPTVEQVKDCILHKFEGVDYGFVVFSGHGAQGEDGQILELADGCINVSNLTNITPKQTLVVNACRKYLSRAINESRAFSFNSGTAATHSQMVLYRKMFNDAIKDSPEGINIIYSTSENEFAYCGTNGSVFINRMIEECDKFGEERKDKKGTFNTKEVVDKIGAMRIDTVNGIDIQKPEIKIPDGIMAFPIAVRERAKITGIKFNKDTRTFSAT